jgi:hypothetical protein
MKRTSSFITDVLGDSKNVSFVDPAVPPSSSSSVSELMRRSQSTPHLTGLEAGSAMHHRTLERQIRSLQRQVGIINDRVSVFEEINSRWGLRYTRRFALVGNLVVGGWLFLHRLVDFLRQRRAQLLQAMMPKIQLQLRASAPVHMGPLISGAIVYSLQGGAWVFFICAALLSRNRSWSKLAGATTATGYAAYLSFMGVAASWPWAVVLSVCGNVSYLVANFNSQAPELSTYAEARDLTTLDGLEGEE